MTALVDVAYHAQNKKIKREQTSVTLFGLCLKIGPVKWYLDRKANVSLRDALRNKAEETKLGYKKRLRDVFIRSASCLCVKYLIQVQ